VAWKHYDPAQGKETTFIWTVAHNHIRNLLRKEIKRLNTMESAGLLDDHNTDSWDCASVVVAQDEWERLLKSLSPDARAVCSIITDSNKPYLPTDKPLKCQQRIRKLLQWKGWDAKRINACFHELKLALHSV